MKIIVYETQDGVSICCPCYTDPIFKNLTEEQIIALVIKKDVPLNSKYKIIEKSDLKALDRNSRKDWRFSTADGVHIPKVI